jgi:hypothetical protein
LTQNNNNPDHSTLVRLNPLLLLLLNGFMSIKTIGVHRGMSKWEEDGHRPPTLHADLTRNGHKAVSGMVRLSGIEE